MLYGGVWIPVLMCRQFLLPKPIRVFEFENSLLDTRKRQLSEGEKWVLKLPIQQTGTIFWCQHFPNVVDFLFDGNIPFWLVLGKLLKIDKTLSMIVLDSYYIVAVVVKRPAFFLLFCDTLIPMVYWNTFLKQFVPSLLSGKPGMHV